MSGALQRYAEEYVKVKAIETAKTLFANQADYALVRVSIDSDLLSDEELLRLQAEVNSK